MLASLPFVPLIPLVSALVLLILGRRLSSSQSSLLGVGSITLSAFIAFGIAFSFWSNPPEGHSFTHTLWPWLKAGDFSIGFSLYLDALSLTMMLVITGVGALIHLFSTQYMANDPGYHRYFGTMNLFVCAMLLLILGDNMVLLYLGWEGVGLCSFLLIGFWYTDPAKCAAARKAFVVTRIGDTAMAIGLFLAFVELGTLHIPSMLGAASTEWSGGSTMATAVALLLLGGAVGKSAQLPLQTWLPDAMAGPTPTSALIHAATMVTAGVYLIARTNTIFALSETAMFVVALIGLLTLLIAGVSAVAQRDIKRVLAYSTISQIGYMFLALGVGAWSAAIFHFMTHAFFKALLFLGAGAIIYALHHEQDMFKMGGLRKKLPRVYWTFLLGAAALAGFPLVSAGFYSKDLILAHTYLSEYGGGLLWFGALLGALLTAFYTFRMIFLTFFGEAKTEVHHKPGWAMHVPLLVLAVLSVIGGLVETPHTLGHVTLFSHFMETALPAQKLSFTLSTELGLQLAAVIAALGGITLAFLLYCNPSSAALSFRQNVSGHGFGATLTRFLASGCGFDWLYDRLFVKPLAWLVAINRRDIVDRGYVDAAHLVMSGSRVLVKTQNGFVRRYASAVAIGSVLIIALVVWL